MPVLLTILLLAALLLSLQPAIAQEIPDNEAAQWQFTAAAGVGEIPVTWNISYRVYDSPKWAGWIDGFWAPPENTIGAGASVQYKPVSLPWFDAVGAGALYDGQEFLPTIYVKKSLLEF